jgi:hypothetical protein
VIDGRGRLRQSALPATWGVRGARRTTRAPAPRTPVHWCCRTTPPCCVGRYGGGGYGPSPGYGPYGPYSRSPYARRGGRGGGRDIYYVLPEAFGASAAPRGMPGAYRGGPPGPYRGGAGGGGGFPGAGGSPVAGLINIATNLLLQLPFSRRVAVVCVPCSCMRATQRWCVPCVRMAQLHHCSLVAHRHARWRPLQHATRAPKHAKPTQALNTHPQACRG